MKTRNTSTASSRTLVIAGVLFSISQFLPVPTALAEERQFLVMLANSPKQFAGGDPAQLASQEAIRKQYFDVDDPTIDSFAEFWEEISYGDVTISGDVKDWINLPWRIEIDPAISTTAAGIPFFDLDGDGVYEYGVSEQFDNNFSQAIGAFVNGDTDGDPGGIPDGPFGPGPGSGHTTANGFPVWKPGERFVDMDGDGVWDALDELNNMMDWDKDSLPDLAGPWIDLNGDGLIANESDTCLYLPDDDNDGNPNCCPNGAGTGSTCDCDPTKWTTPNGDFIDCNGNLIPDVCEVDFPQAVADCFALGIPGVASCTATTGPGGRACLQDTSPFEIDNNGDRVGAPDGLPDECQFANWNVVPAQNGQPGGCGGTDACIPLVGPAANPPDRCEFDDANNDGEIDIVEPWEDFMRRWNPCIHDIDANAILIDEDQTHWIKVYDPTSSNKDVVQSCAEPPESFTYGSPAYIRNNYPAKPADVAELIRQAGDVPERIIWGPHDPLGLIPLPTPPVPPLPSTTDDCPAWRIATYGCVCGSGRPCGTEGNSYGMGNLCLPPDRQTELGIPLADFPCETAGASDCDSGKIIPDYCFVGYHHQFDPPDKWTDVTPANVPAGQVFSAKMQVEAGDPCPPASGTCRAKFVTGKRTPEPGTELTDRSWYGQFWRERYRHSASPLPPPNLPAAPPPWDGGTGGDNIPQVRLFPDVEPADNDAPTTRRYFAANRGGRRNGIGWKDGACGDLSRFVLFESGDLPNGFATLCDAPILPEEANGIGNARQFFDGWVEYDDLPSSKYHRGGDQRLGEVTSPNVGNTSIFGQDIGPHIADRLPQPDQFIAAAGPLAVNIHGNGSFDAGNQLNIELLTWRTQPPFNDGEEWESELLFDGQARFHPYAGPSGVNLGFRDFNLDGLVDLGESRYEGTENYTADAVIGTNDGVITQYPWHRSRIVEDCVEVNDRLLDFDDFVDQVALDAVTCARRGAPSTLLPPRYRGHPTRDIIAPDGVTSGIVLLPPGAHDPGILRLAPRWLPIHNNDNDNPDKSLSLGSGREREKVNWNIFFHTLVRSIDSMSLFETGASGSFLTRFAAHEYGHAWQGFPDLYDYDVFSTPELENAPVGLWDTMANGGMVHMVPALKSSRCTHWIEPVDLKGVLTPGVDATITIPPYETVRDRNTYFLENPAVSGERYYFYSVGQGMDKPPSVDADGNPVPGAPNGGMPGEGMLILHTDEGSNPDALPSGQQNATRFSFLVVQADGLGSLQSPVGAPGFNRGDASDPWPGTLGRTQFNFDTTPSATWYTQDAWTGLNVLNVEPDGAGSIRLTLNWQPTNIPSLSFTSPPGGASVDQFFTVGFDATDVHGGTTIQLYYTSDLADITPPGITIPPSHGGFIGSMQKVTPGTRRMSMNWNVFGVADGSYFIFAKLIPGPGADGVETDHTDPIPARDNVSNGTLTINNVDINGNAARAETWTVRLDDVQNDIQDWIVNATLSQPAPADQNAVQETCRHLFITPTTNVAQYVSCDGEVTFTLVSDLSSFAVGDSWSFVTTGITAPSSSLTILDGDVNEDPQAEITVDKLTGFPPLTVTFDAFNSIDPNGTPLNFAWDFGDGTNGTTGASTQHTFPQPGTFTVTLTATNPLNNRFGEAQVDIIVINNSPTARISADPTSGVKPLTVAFSAAGSSDGSETAAADLIYQWNFGDGGSINPEGLPGLLFAETSHTYTHDANDTLCTSDHVCVLTATLTVTDAGGKQDEDTITIIVGNTQPEAIVTHTRLQGGDPHTVTFNAKDSFDADGNELTVTWEWGDGSPPESHPAVTGENGSGDVSHTFTRREGEVLSEYLVTATVGDGISTSTSGATVQVSEAFVDSSQPHADFTITPNPPVLGESFEVDASNSFDRPDRDAPLAKFEWDWGDGSPSDTGVKPTHTYTNEGLVTITLVVTDDEDNHGTARKTFQVAEDGGGGGGDGGTNGIPTARITVSPASRVGFVGDEFVFSGATSSDPDEGDTLTYRWTFGLDGTSPQVGSEVSHRFEVTGEFLVLLTVTDSSGASDDATLFVTVNPSPDSPRPIIGTGPRSGAAPLTLTFNGLNSFDPNGDPITYRWDFFTGSEPKPEDTPLDSATGAIVTHLFADEGVFSVVLVVDDGQGAVRSSPEIVTVTARVTDPGTEQPVVDGNANGGAATRPSGLCGFGMLLGLCGSMFGLTIMQLTRRRRGEGRGRVA